MLALSVWPLPPTGTKAGGNRQGQALENIRGAVIMVFAMAGFAIEDMFIKQMAGAVPTGEIILFLCLGGIVTFGGRMIRQGNVRLRDGFTNRYLWLRNFGELIGTVGFVTAITTSPLSTASAILQANPQPAAIEPLEGATVAQQDPMP